MRRLEESVSSQTKIPVSIDEWERVLVCYFLGVGSDGDASDIHSIEVSPRTLALACGVDPTYAEEAEEAFRGALLRDQAHLLRALREGPQRRSSTEAPNCFAPLAMTLLIDILLDGAEYAGNQFRVKLADWLQMDRTFNDLSGVKLMWEEVARWLNRRVAQGQPFRRLVLPQHPINWRHIGYSRRLSFPNRADMKVAVQVLSVVSRYAQDSPVALIHAAAQLTSKKNVSIGLKEAYADFVRSYYSKRRALADHRFWRLIEQARAEQQEARKERHVTLEIAVTADDEREFRIIQEHAEEAHLHLSLTAALRDEALVSCSSLGTAVTRGLLFFRLVGLGRWKAEPDLANCRDRVLAAFHQRFLPAIGGRLGKVENSGQWNLTVDPVDAEKVAFWLRACGVMPDPSARLFRAAVSDGVRVHGAWLGLPGFLPAVEADTDDLRVVSEEGEAVDLRAVAGSSVRLVSAAPVVGTYFVEPQLLPSESRPPWRLRLQFVDRAAPHLALDGARQRLPLLIDWNATRPISVMCEAIAELGWGRAGDAVEWLLEALYCSGQTGWDESEIVEVVRRAGLEPARTPWLALRMLQEGGVIEPRLRQGWKGRVWTLAAPRIVAARRAGAPVALAEGALCAQMLEAFFTAAKAMGGVPFRMPGTMDWSVPVTGAVGADPERLARLLCWDLVQEPEEPSSVPMALVQTERRAENYVLAYTWCWQVRRFLTSPADAGKVRLTQLSHPAGSDHDVYRVESSRTQWHFLSRQAAIVAAHSAARTPLLAFEGDRLTVTARDGGLPDLLATALRRRRLASGGFTGACYGYAASVEDARWLARLLPGCLGDVPGAEFPGAGEVLSRARRSGGAIRPQWRGAGLAL